MTENMHFRPYCYPCFFGQYFLVCCLPEYVRLCTQWINDNDNDNDYDTVYVVCQYTSHYSHLSWGVCMLQFTVAPM